MYLRLQLSQSRKACVWKTPSPTVQTMSCHQKGILDAGTQKLSLTISEKKEKVTHQPTKRLQSAKNKKARTQQSL